MKDSWTTERFAEAAATPALLMATPATRSSEEGEEWELTYKCRHRTWSWSGWSAPAPTWSPAGRRRSPAGWSSPSPPPSASRYEAIWLPGLESLPTNHLNNQKTNSPATFYPALYGLVFAGNGLDMVSIDLCSWRTGKLLRGDPRPVDTSEFLWFFTTNWESLHTLELPMNKHIAQLSQFAIAVPRIVREVESLDGKL